MVVIFLAFGLNHLGEFLNRDEPLWLYERVPKYYNAWADWDLSRTYVNDKPGVLPAILAGTINLFSPYSEYDHQNFHQYLFWWRLPILVFNGAMLFFVFFLIRKLLNYRAAWLIVGALCLTPQLIAYSQMVNPDSTAWTTAFVAFLCFLIYLKNLELKFVLMTAIFFGLALISKFNTTILFPVFFLMLYLSYLFGSFSRKEFLTGFNHLMIIYSLAVGIYVLFTDAASLVFVPLIYAASRRSRRLRWLEWGPCVYLGKISYGLYVYHQLVALTFQPIFQRFGVSYIEWQGALYPEKGLTYFALSSATTIAIASLSWHFFEHPINRLKSHFDYSARRPSP